LRAAIGLVLGKLVFRDEPARALLAGLAAHSCLPLEWAPSAAIGLVLGVMGHGVGWPFPQGGAQRLADALASYLRSLGGTIVTGQRVGHIDELPPAHAILLDVTPQQLLALADGKLPPRYRHALERVTPGTGVFKVDWALDAPIPWQHPDCARAGTLHLGGTLREIAAAERAPWQGEHSPAPYVLLAQQSRFDATRAPLGKHTAWAYCHLPLGSTRDMTNAIEAQIERFAPGFRNRILARSTMGPAALEGYNANLVGGDITGGAPTLWQLFTRPTARINPYTTPVPGLYLCSSATPPGPGVHGMCGYHAALTALHRMR
jgi:phytoene dehydrogenase-like protein